jgi:AcrR family transcriptional regulator
MSVNQQSGLGFDQVTVHAITQRAQINRATFYRHYSDKYDLADRLTDLLFVDVRHVLVAELDNDPYAATQALFEHVKQYAEFYRAMLGPKGIPGFGERVRAEVERQMEMILPIQEAALKMPLPALLRYMSAAQVGFVQWWLENNMPCSTAQAAFYLVNLHTEGGLAALGLAGPENS